MKKKKIQKHLLEDLRMWLSNFNFVVIYTIEKTLVLFKNHLNYVKDIFFKYFFKKYSTLFSFLKNSFL